MIRLALDIVNCSNVIIALWLCFMLNWIIGRIIYKYLFISSKFTQVILVAFTYCWYFSFLPMKQRTWSKLKMLQLNKESLTNSLEKNQFKKVAITRIRKIQHLNDQMKIKFIMRSFGGRKSPYEVALQINIKKRIEINQLLLAKLCNSSIYTKIQTLICTNGSKVLLYNQGVDLYMIFFRFLHKSMLNHQAKEANQLTSDFEMNHILHNV